MIVDDHLLRSVLQGRIPPALALMLDDHVVATTNLFYARLCRSVAAAQRRLGIDAGTLTELGIALSELPEPIRITPMRGLAWRMAAVVNQHRVSLLGAEAVVAAAHLDATLCVASTDDGPGIRAAAEAVGVPYVVIAAA